MRIQSINLKAIAFAGMLLSAGLVKAQSAAPSTLPYQGEQGKAEWVKANPDAYRQLGGQTNSQTLAPKSEQMTEAEKAAWVKAHPAEYAKLVGSVQNASKSQQFPNYVDTGNPNADAYAYAQAKAAWVAAHPKEYAEMTKQPEPVLNNTNPNAGQRVKVTQAELNDMSAAKRQAVLADPNVEIVK